MTKEIKICMGSSCFARGNAENLEFLEKYIKENSIDAEVEVYGSRCENICEKGPNIIVDGTIYNDVNTEKIIEILRK